MGWSNFETATRLEWSEQKTAERVAQILAKLELSSRIELAFYACTEEDKAALRRSADHLRVEAIDFTHQ